MSSIIPPHATSCHIDYSFFFFFSLSLLDFVCVSSYHSYTLRPDDFIGSILCYITLHDIAGESGFINHSSSIDSFRKLIINLIESKFRVINFYTSKMNRNGS